MLLSVETALVLNIAVISKFFRCEANSESAVRSGRL